MDKPEWLSFQASTRHWSLLAVAFPGQRFPPDTVRISPVIQAEAWEARKTATGLKSEG
jgi:hypothetical protein